MQHRIFKSLRKCEHFVTVESKTDSCFGHKFVQFWQQTSILFFKVDSKCENMAEISIDFILYGNIQCHIIQSCRHCCQIYNLKKKVFKGTSMQKYKKWPL